MRHGNDLHRGVAIDGIEHVDGGAAGHAESVGDAAFGQEAGNVVSELHQNIASVVAVPAEFEFTGIGLERR
jgi:hypothetical protein